MIQAIAAGISPHRPGARRGAYQSVNRINSGKKRRNPMPNAIDPSRARVDRRTRWNVRSRYGQRANPKVQTAMSPNKSVAGLDRLLIGAGAKSRLIDNAIANAASEIAKALPAIQRAAEFFAAAANIAIASSAVID